MNAGEPAAERLYAGSPIHYHVAVMEPDQTTRCIAVRLLTAANDEANRERRDHRRAVGVQPCASTCLGPELEPQPRPAR